MAEERTWFQKPAVWTGCLVVLGVGLRLYHYARDPSMWHDEAALVVNVLGRGFGDLLGQLDLAEAAPPLFLWVERAVALVAGDSQYALRLIPFVASCLALILMGPLARRVLPSSVVPWAVFLMAFSNRLIWHSCEAKPYAVEVLATTVVLAVFVGMRPWPLARQCLVWTLLAPVLIWVAYPGCFLCGGVLVALLPAVWRQRRWQTWLGYGLLATVVGASFMLLLLGPVQAQRCDAMTSCWLDHFPHWDRPWTVPGWTLFSSLDMVRYCFEPTGHALALIALIGAIHLWRQGQAVLVLLLTVPGALPLLAAFGRAYPWGGARVEIYLLPALALLIAAGLGPLWNWLCTRARFAIPVLAAVLVWPLGLSACRIVVPWTRADCAGAAAYVQGHRRAGDQVLGNHWEYLYYFRDLGPRFTLLEKTTPPPAGPMWLIVTGPTAEERAKVGRFLTPGEWQVVDHQEFEQTVVYRLTRDSEQVAGARR